MSRGRRSETRRLRRALTAPSGPIRSPVHCSSSGSRSSQNRITSPCSRPGISQHRFGFSEAGQVIEVAVLTVRIVAVVVAQPLRRGRHDADRVAADDAHQLLATARVFLAVDHWAGSREWGIGNREVPGSTQYGRSESFWVLAGRPRASHREDAVAIQVPPRRSQCNDSRFPIPHSRLHQCTVALAGVPVAASSVCSKSTPTRMNSMTSASALSSSSPLSEYSKCDAAIVLKSRRISALSSERPPASALPAKPTPPRNPRAPLDQRIGAHVDRRVGCRQQRLEAQIRIVEPGRAFVEQLPQRCGACGGCRLGFVVFQPQRCKPVARIGMSDPRTGSRSANHADRWGRRRTPAWPAVRRVARG